MKTPEKTKNQHSVSAMDKQTPARQDFTEQNNIDDKNTEHETTATSVPEKQKSIQGKSAVDQVPMTTLHEGSVKSKVKTYEESTKNSDQITEQIQKNKDKVEKATDQAKQQAEQLLQQANEKLAEFQQQEQAKLDELLAEPEKKAQPQPAAQDNQNSNTGNNFNNNKFQQNISNNTIEINKLIITEELLKPQQAVEKRLNIQELHQKDSLKQINETMDKAPANATKG